MQQLIQTPLPPSAFVEKIETLMLMAIFRKFWLLKVF